VLTGWHVWPLVQVLLAARRLGIPVIMRGEANALRRWPWRVRAVHRALLSLGSASLPIGQASRAFYRGYGIAAERLFDAPYFIDNARFAAAATQANRAASRARWGIPAESLCFCFAGKLEPKKRILDVLAALALASQGGANIHLLVIGTGELESEARAFAAQHALPVTFAGFLNQSEIASAYVASDALVLPSDFGETWGLVVNEAMACGRPAVVSDRVGCGPDLVIPGATGDRFAFGDMRALADVFERWAATRGDVERMGHAARERVFAHYGPANAVEGTLRAIEWVRGRR
jgi:glycosyltransferase involved in cell wall biosynthesis